MAFPSSHPHSASGAAFSHQSGSATGNGSTAAQRPHPSPRCLINGGQDTAQAEGEHQLEKLEFALAVALTRGDQARSRCLRDQIAALGGNREEPGT